jgi:hypothetical protein
MPLAYGQIAIDITLAIVAPREIPTVIGPGYFAPG